MVKENHGKYLLIMFILTSLMLMYLLLYVDVSKWVHIGIGAFVILVYPVLYNKYILYTEYGFFFSSAIVICIGTFTICALVIKDVMLVRISGLLVTVAIYGLMLSICYRIRLTFNLKYTLYLITDWIISIIVLLSTIFNLSIVIY